VGTVTLATDRVRSSRESVAALAARTSRRASIVIRSVKSTWAGLASRLSAT
jgi:hypothetical protein